MQTNSLNGRIYFVVLLAILLMLHAQADDLTLTSSQPQNDDFDLFSGFHLGDPPAGSFGNLLGPGDSKVGSDWAMGEAGLKLNSNSQAEKTLSPLLAEASIACPNRSRLRRSRLGMRDQRDDSRCQSPYSRTTTPTTPEAQQGAPTPDKQQEGRPWPKLTDSTGETELWLQLYTARGVEGEANLKVCNRHGLLPVCYPYKVPAIPPLVSPALIVEPCRFCKWNSLSLPCLAPI